MEESPKCTRKTSKHGRRQSKAISRQKKRRPSRIAEVRECTLYGNARTAPTKFQFVTSLWNISASDVASETIQTVSRSLLINIVFLRPTCLSKTLLVLSFVHSSSSVCCRYHSISRHIVLLHFIRHTCSLSAPIKAARHTNVTTSSTSWFRPVLTYFFAAYHPIFSLFVCEAVTGTFVPCY